MNGTNRLDNQTIHFRAAKSASVHYCKGYRNLVYNFHERQVVTSYGVEDNHEASLSQTTIQYTAQVWTYGIVT
jgi:hypothetical protein